MGKGSTKYLKCGVSQIVQSNANKLVIMFLDLVLLRDKIKPHNSFDNYYNEQGRCQLCKAHCT